MRPQHRKQTGATKLSGRSFGSRHASSEVGRPKVEVLQPQCVPKWIVLGLVLMGMASWPQMPSLFVKVQEC